MDTTEGAEMGEDAERRRWQAERFEDHRPRLRAVAYRMLGSLAEADDAVQEAWLRLDGSSHGEIDNLGGWLTTVVGRVCIDVLRARSARREYPAGECLSGLPVGPDPDGDPEQQSLIADSVGLALLVVLETLSPAERLAFVLHDTFGLPFAEIAPIVDRTPEATRQLASRARRRVRGAPATPAPDLARQQEIVSAFLAAARNGDFERLLGLLDPDVVFCRRAPHGPLLLSGAGTVARQVAESGPRFAKHCRPALVGGASGVAIDGPRGPIGFVGFTFRRGRIIEIDLAVDPTAHRLPEPGEW